MFAVPRNCHSSNERLNWAMVLGCNGTFEDGGVGVSESGPVVYGFSQRGKRSTTGSLPLFNVYWNMPVGYELSSTWVKSSRQHTRIGVIDCWAGCQDHRSIINLARSLHYAAQRWLQVACVPLGQSRATAAKQWNDGASVEGTCQSSHSSRAVSSLELVPALTGWKLYVAWPRVKATHRRDEARSSEQRVSAELADCVAALVDIKWETRPRVHTQTHGTERYDVNEDLRGRSALPHHWRRSATVLPTVRRHWWSCCHHRQTDKQKPRIRIRKRYTIVYIYVGVVTIDTLFNVQAVRRRCRRTKFYRDPIFYLLLFCRQLPFQSELTERNSTKPVRCSQLASECDLKMHARNVEYPLPLKIGCPKPNFFGGLAT